MTDIIQTYETLPHSVKAMLLTPDNVQTALDFIPRQFKPRRVTHLLAERIRKELDSDALICIKPLESDSRYEGIEENMYIVLTEENKLMVLNPIEFLQTFRLA